MTREEKIKGLYSLKEYLVENPIELKEHKSLPITLIDYAIQALEQEPKTGHWISDAIQGEIDGQIVKAFTCSKCGAISVFRMTDGKIVNGDLCPNCGAKLGEVLEDSNDD